MALQRIKHLGRRRVFVFCGRLLGTSEQMHRQRVSQGRDGWSWMKLRPSTLSGTPFTLYLWQ